MANFTETGNSTYILSQVRALPTGISAFVSALNMVLSITASLGNALILIALYKVSSIYPPTKLLFRCLAVTDLCVGLFSQPLFAITLLPAAAELTDVKTLRYFLVLSFVFYNLSILTSTAISVDRLLALFWGLRYRHVVTLKRVRAVIICFSLSTVSFGLLNVFRYRRTTVSACLVVAVVSLVISAYCHSKIFLKLRKNQVHQRQSNGGGFPLNTTRYRKTISSIAWVQLVLFACYVPFIIYVLTNLIAKYTWNDIAFLPIVTLLYLHSSLNPFLYCWKIRDVRKRVKDTIRQLVCCLSS